MRIPFSLWYYPFVVVPLLFGIYFFVPLINGQEHDKNVLNQINFYRTSGQKLNAVRLELDQIGKHDSNRDFHLYFIRDYYRLDDGERTLIKHEYPDFYGDLQEVYKKKWEASKGDEFYLLSSIRLLLTEENSSRLTATAEEINSRLQDEVPSENSKWYSGLQALMGIALSEEQKLNLWKHDWVVNGPSRLAFEQIQRTASAEETLLFADSAKRSGIPVSFSERIQLGWQASPLHFLRVLGMHILESVSTVNGFVFWIAMFIWLGFLYAVDVFRERPRWWLFFLLTDCVFKLLMMTFLFSLVHLKDTEFTGLSSDVLLTGLPEEFIKFFPVLLCWFIFRKKIQPMGWLFLGTLSALVFALIENTFYYHGYFNTGIMAARTMLGITGHIGLTLIPVNALIVADQRKKKAFIIVIGFFIAAILHGLNNFLLNYDFIYAILILVVLVMAMGSAINNALNVSASFAEKSIPHNGIMVLFTIGFCTVCAWQYYFTGVEFGWENSRIAFQKSMIQYGFLLLIIPVALTRIELRKGHWTALDVFGTRNLVRKKERNKNYFRLRIADKNSGIYSEIKVLSENKMLRDSKGNQWHLFSGSDNSSLFLSFIEQGDTFYDFNVGVWIKIVSNSAADDAIPDQSSFLGRGYLSPEIGDSNLAE